MKFMFAIIIASIPSLLFTDDKELASTYIGNFKDIAIEEMHRTGIPASIKLAQGLLESDWGRSDLATTANNHFGIKCGGTWDGNTFYKEDDDKDDHGQLIESCFRSFTSPIESYTAHSDFLTDPKKEFRYGFLFEYGSTDYISWANGLKKSGYASDPDYPDKLISIIEKYDLSKFDQAIEKNHAFAVNQVKENSNTETTKSDVLRSAPNAHTEEIKNNTKKDEASTSIKRVPSKHVSRLAYNIESINNCRMVVAKGGETLNELSKTVGLSVEDILSMNEIYNQSSVVLAENEIIYIEKKKRSYRGDHEYHKVEEGETMESIAQLYGLRVKTL